MVAKCKNDVYDCTIKTIALLYYCTIETIVLLKKQQQ